MRAEALVCAMLLDMRGTKVDDMRFQDDDSEVRHQRHSLAFDDLSAMTPDFIGLAERLLPAFSTTSHRP